MRKGIQYTAFYLQTFLTRHIKELLLSALSGFLISLIIIQTYPLFWKFVGQRSQIIGVIGRFSEDNLPLDIKNQISFGLTSLSSSGEPIPAAAGSWEIEKEGIDYIFHLNPKLIWHDGKNLQASDINIKLKGATLQVIDQNTFKISLTEIYAPLPVLLSAPIFKSELIGLGQYRVLRLKKTEGKIDEMTLAPLDKKQPSIIYKFYINHANAALAFKLGEINKLIGLDEETTFQNWRNVNIIPNTEYDKLVAILFNLKDEHFKDKEIRQAFAYAIPEFADVEKAVSPIAPNSWAYSRKIRLYNYDQDISRKIFSKSALATESAQLTLYTFSHLLKRAQILIDAWQKVGVNVKIKVINSIPADYQILLVPLTIPSDPDQYLYWQSTQDATNLTHYSSAKIDKLLEDGRKKIDLKLRKKIYADFQLYLIDDAPAIFLYYPKVYTVERK